MGVADGGGGAGPAKRFKTESDPLPAQQSRYSHGVGRAQIKTESSSGDDRPATNGLKLTVKLCHGGTAQAVSSGDKTASGGDVTARQPISACRGDDVTPRQPISGGGNVQPCQVRLVSNSVSDTPAVKVESKKFFPDLSPEMTSTELMSACEALGHNDGNISTSVLPTSELPYAPARKPRVALTKQELSPQTPCINIKDASEAFSQQLLQFCLHRPIVNIRNLAAACGVDLNLFSTKTLVEAHPNHPVEIRTQMEQGSDENWDPTMSEQVWYCTSHRSHTTLAKYAEYQAGTLLDWMEAGHKDINPIMNDFIGDSATRRMTKFGTNCDLSDERKWGTQLKALQKLPSWVRVVSSGNMLSHAGHQILGMNTVQEYLKVPCSRTPGHQENNNFPAININVGPGNSEWFGVPDDYWGEIQNMCQASGMDYLHGSWWPNMKELQEAGIPVFRFMQCPGDTVWINSGCVHWVQASGWCNNIAWNVGPLSGRSYRRCMERYEWNKSQKFQSIVPMVNLTWNLAKNLRTSDREVCRRIRTTLMHSVRQIVQSRSFADAMGIPTRYHGKKKNEPAHYCGVCDEETFDILFVKEGEKRHVPHCLRCARQQSPDLRGWICLEEYSLGDLLQIYDCFSLLLG